MPDLALRVPPPVVVAVAALLMWVIAWALRPMELAMPARILAIVIFLSGLLIVVAGLIEFRRARTTVNPLDPAAASSLVVNGVYGLTRNPMYLGMAIILIAWAVYLGNVLALLVMPCFIAYMNRFQIIPEETVLRSLFPSEFEPYAKRVRRWL